MQHPFSVLGVGALLRCATLGPMAIASPAADGGLALVATRLLDRPDGSRLLIGTLRNRTAAAMPASTVDLALQDGRGREVGVTRRHLRPLAPGACCTFHAAVRVATAVRFRLRLVGTACDPSHPVRHGR